MTIGAFKSTAALISWCIDRQCITSWFKNTPCTTLCILHWAKMRHAGFSWPSLGYYWVRFAHMLTGSSLHNSLLLRPYQLSTSPLTAQQYLYWRAYSFLFQTHTQLVVTSSSLTPSGSCGSSVTQTGTSLLVASCVALTLQSAALASMLAGRVLTYCRLGVSSHQNRPHLLKTMARLGAQRFPCFYSYYGAPFVKVFRTEYSEPRLTVGGQYRCVGVARIIVKIFVGRPIRRIACLNNSQCAHSLNWSSQETVELVRLSSELIVRLANFTGAV